LIYKNTHTNVIIDIDLSLLNELSMIGKSYYPNEFGGFLIGYYSDDFKTLIITNFIIPTKFKVSKISFERDTNGIEEKLKEFYNRTPKEYYIGEWHTHPNSSTSPSNRDLKAMISIANHPNVVIKNPILLIIGYNNANEEFAFYFYKEKQLYKYEQQD
jgi:integrative and conjugative element protein (TIGR02256 family)